MWGSFKGVGFKVQGLRPQTNFVDRNDGKAILELEAPPVAWMMLLLHGGACCEGLVSDLKD